MSEHLTTRDVCELAAYAQVSLAEEEVAQMTADLNGIIEGLRPLAEYVVEEAEPAVSEEGGNCR